MGSPLFVARFDVERIDFSDSNPEVNTWQVYGKIVDPTGSYNAYNVSSGDKVVMRGYKEDGSIVYDRYLVAGVTTIDSENITAGITYEVPYDPNNQYEGDPIPQIFGNAPITGSFPIGSDMAYKNFLRLPSTYQHLIDPDYEAGMENLNFEQLTDTAPLIEYFLTKASDSTQGFDGVTQRFHTQWPFVPGSLKLYINGVRQRKGVNLGYIEEKVDLSWINDVWTIFIYYPPEVDSGVIVEYIKSGPWR